MGQFHWRQPISRKMSRPWNRELGWYLIIGLGFLQARCPSSYPTKSVKQSIQPEKNHPLVLILSWSSDPWPFILSDCRWHMINILFTVPDILMTPWANRLLWTKHAILQAVSAFTHCHSKHRQDICTESLQTSIINLFHHMSGPYHQKNLATNT